jgi:Spy/CpxP family protein refolding chaperone
LGVLTEDQRASLRIAMEQQREKVRELDEKLRGARKEVFEAGLRAKFDEAAVREKAMAAAKLEADMTVLRAKAFSQMRPELSAQQMEQLANSAPAGGENSGAQERRRPDRKRDENGLPLKEPLPAAKPSGK